MEHKTIKKSENKGTKILLELSILHSIQELKKLHLENWEKKPT